jgi:pimeloyl-ACP methyl ester carboxylesterase
LLIGGGPTSSVPAEKLTAVADLIPDSELIELGGGHYVHQAYPEEFSAVVFGWLPRRS